MRGRCPKSLTFCGRHLWMATNRIKVRITPLTQIRGRECYARSTRAGVSLLLLLLEIWACKALSKWEDGFIINIQPSIFETNCHNNRE